MYLSFVSIGLVNGAKTVPRIHTNKNVPSAMAQILLFTRPKVLKIRSKMNLLKREGGRTVGSGRVATIIE